MYCLQCRYNLRDLPEHRCPECGRRFDPNDPESYDPNPVRRTDPFKILTYVAAYPLLVPVLLFATWLAAYMTLGRAPRVYIDDPNHISPIVSTFNELTSMSFILLMMHLPATPILILAIAYAERARDRMIEKTVTLFLIMLASWGFVMIAAFSFLRGIIDWYLD